MLCDPRTLRHAITPLTPSHLKMLRRQCYTPRGELPQLKGPETIDPGLSYRNTPFRGRHLHFAVHRDRPITVSSLDHRGRHENLSKERMSIAAREVIA